MLGNRLPRLSVEQACKAGAIRAAPAARRSACATLATHRDPTADDPVPKFHDTHDTHDPIKALLDAASAQFMSSPGAALALADEAVLALAALGEQASPAQEARVRRTRGLALHYGGRHAEGLAELAVALAAVPEADLALRSIVLRALSIGSELLGAPEDAVAWAARALTAARAHGGALLEADALLSLGIGYSRSGQAAAGLEQFAQVLVIFEREQAGGSVSVLNNMGINCKNLGRYDESVAHYERALLLVQGDTTTTAVLQSNLSEPLMLLGRLDEAHAALAAALPVLAASGYAEAETNARVTHGRVLLKAGQAAAAQAELEQALRLCAETGGRNYAARAHQTLAELHKQAGAFEPALHHAEAAHAAERAQFNEESDRKVGALRVRMDVASARHEAEMHRARHAEVSSAHDELKALHAALLAADAEKNLLLTRLAEQSRTDGLTGLANRRALDERLIDAQARSRRYHQPLAVALCDLDFFKRINDRFGHATGDEVLRHISALLRAHSRATDVVARYGGEEFCIVFIEADAAVASRLCDTLRAAVAAHDWAAVHPQLAVTLSIGIADDAHLATHEQLLAAADRHLYRAKHEGKNRVCWHGNAPALNEPQMQRASGQP